MNLDTKVQPFQDLENGSKTFDVTGKLAWLGCLETSLHDLQPKAKHIVEIPLLFFMAGTFKFQIVVEDSASKIVCGSTTFRIEAY